MVTASFLSCKRIELFSSTFQSFFEHCEDLDLISEIVIVDDNSSFDELEEIARLADKTNIPYLLVSKKEKRGQAASINIVNSLSENKYLFHVEDDWKFTRRGSFIRTGLKIMKRHPEVRRVCVDLSSSSASLEEAVPAFLEDTEEYYVRPFEEGKWPSFTFRQCLVDLDFEKEKIGLALSQPILSHDGSLPTCETDYAMRFCQAGGRTAFFLNTYVEEISKGKPSSFELNNCSRYNEH